MSAIIRFLELAILWGGFAMVVRFAVLALREPAMRRNYATMLSADRGGTAVEAALARWRRSLGRSLWINLVAIPILLVGFLMFVSEFSSGIHLN